MTTDAEEEVDGTKTVPAVPLNKKTQTERNTELLNKVLSKISVTCDRAIDQSEKQRLREICINYGIYLLRLFGDQALRLSTEEQAKKTFAEREKRSSNLYVSPVADSLPPWLSYNPLQSNFNSTFAADKKVRYLSVFFQSYGYTSPMQKPDIDTDNANFMGRAVGETGNFTLEGYPRCKVRRFYVRAVLDGYNMPGDGNFWQFQGWLTDKGDAENPWKIVFNSGDIYRYQTDPPDFNAGNVILEWNTLAHLDAICTWTAWNWNGTYMCWYWQFDMPGEGIHMEANDHLQLVCGQPPNDTLVKKIYVTADVEYVTSDFNFAAIMKESYVTSTLSTLLDSK